MNRVLTDYHHSDLLEAMHLLFEDRLGYTVYIPGGMEWWQEGIAPYGSEEVARQFLEGPTHGFHPREYRRITLSEVRATDGWAVMVATMAEQQYGFKRLADEKGARFAVQVGNSRQYVDMSLDPLVFGAEGLRMHQEFDKDGAFRFSAFDNEILRNGMYPDGRHSVASFVNIFTLLPDYRHFQEAEALLPTWRFATFGHHGTDGFLKPTAAIADSMRAYAFAWHDKETGDGWGHVIHYWAAIGRPLIGHASYYRGQMAEDLWEDGVTCIDLDKHSIPETVELMQLIAADSERYDAMCREIRRRLDARIDYQREAETMRDALTLVTA